MSAMQSHEAIKQAVDTVGVKAVAHEMKLSPSLIYKWCEPRETCDDVGARNPLDRLAQLFEITQSPAPAEWLCQATGGFRVPNAPCRKLSTHDVMDMVQRMLREFTEVLEAVTSSIKDGSGIDEGEARRIRREWEQLKAVAEGFVVGCEQGLFADAASGPAPAPSPPSHQRGANL